MDDVAHYNRDRWRKLVQVNALFTRPKLDLNPESARQYLDPRGVLGEVAEKNVLCLASGGGQQSIAFAILGANVTVSDLSPEQLEIDGKSAQELGLTLETLVADMRDLSHLPGASFDVVWQPYSLNFVPRCLPVFQEVARVLRPGGLYHLMTTNPFAFGMTNEDWDGVGYPVSKPYESGRQASYTDQEFVYDRSKVKEEIPRPIEYCHTLSDIIGGLATCGFCLKGVFEEASNDPENQPGDWEHFKSFLPPWLTFWAIKES